MFCWAVKLNASLAAAKQKEVHIIHDVQLIIKIQCRVSLTRSPSSKVRIPHSDAVIFVDNETLFPFSSFFLFKNIFSFSLHPERKGKSNVYI